MSFITDIINKATDSLHITDSEAPKRAYEALQLGNDNALAQMTNDIAPSMKMLSDAMLGRTLDENLDRYEQENRIAQDRTLKDVEDIWNARNTGSRTEDFINPFSEDMQKTAVNKMQGSLGSSLQSSGGQRKMADTLNDIGNQMWDTAFQQALGDSRNRMNAAGTSAKMANQYGQMANQKLDALNQPALDYLNLNNDAAMQKYAGRVALNEAAGAVAGQNKPLF